MFGTFGTAGGKYQGVDVYWEADDAWRSVPQQVQDFTICGFRPLSKWLSYRIGLPLTVSDRGQFILLTRRVKAILDLAESADELFALAAAAPLEAMVSAEAQ